MKSFNNVVPLNNLVKSAVIDLGEDLTKVEATFNHWALRGYKEMTAQMNLNFGLKRVLLPIHKKLNTVQIPDDYKRLSFIGIIDEECGYKIPLILDGNLVSDDYEKKDCVDKCEKCNADKDVCEKMNVVVEKSTVYYPSSMQTIVTEDGIDFITEDGKKIITEYSNSDVTPYENITTKIYDNGGYYLVKEFWVWNLKNNYPEKITQKDFITDFDLSECGCIKNTEENISKIKEHCYSCYCSCYMPCKGSTDAIGRYKIYEGSGVIQLDRNFDYDNVYLEYYGNLPKVNNEFIVPEILSESIIYYLVFKYKENRKNYSIGEKQLAKNDYIVKKRDALKIMSRISLSDIKDAARRLPLFYINTNFCGGNYNVSKSNKNIVFVSNNNQPITPIVPIPPAPISSDIVELPLGATTYVIPKDTLIEMFWILSDVVLSVNIGTTNSGTDIVDSFGENNVTDLVNGGVIEVNKPFKNETVIYFSGTNNNTKIIIFKKTVK